jgi:hypothetical protein
MEIAHDSCRITPEGWIYRVVKISLGRKVMHESDNSLMMGSEKSGNPSDRVFQSVVRKSKLSLSEIIKTGTTDTILSEAEMRIITSCETSDDDTIASSAFDLRTTLWNTLSDGLPDEKTFGTPEGWIYRVVKISLGRKVMHESDNSLMMLSDSCMTLRPRLILTTR